MRLETECKHVAGPTTTYAYNFMSHPAARTGWPGLRIVVAALESLRASLAFTVDDAKESPWI
jgi:hypothetical protein